MTACATKPEAQNLPTSVQWTPDSIALKPCDVSDAKVKTTGDIVARDGKRGKQRDACAAQVEQLRGSYDAWRKNVGNVKP